MNIEQRVAYNVKTICRRKGLSIAKLAYMIGIERQNFYTMLSTGVVKIRTAEALAEALGVEVADLMFGDFGNAD